MTSVHRDEATMDMLDIAQMAPEEFTSYAIVLGVEPAADPYSQHRLKVSPQHQGDMEQLRQEIQRRLPLWRRGLSDTDVQQIEARLLSSLMSMDMRADAMCRRIFGGRPLVMARADVVRQHGRLAVAQQAHRTEVTQALAERRPVHSDSLALYGLSRTGSPFESLLSPA